MSVQQQREGTPSQPNSANAEFWECRVRMWRWWEWAKGFLGVGGWDAGVQARDPKICQSTTQFPGQQGAASGCSLLLNSAPFLEVVQIQLDSLLPCYLEKGGKFPLASQ